MNRTSRPLRTIDESKACIDISMVIIVKATQALYILLYFGMTKVLRVDPNRFIKR